jgi:Xaa-Pro aminopeptidase
MIIKTKKEIALIQEACKITDDIFRKIISDFHFQTERDLADFILEEIKKRKLRPSFPPIVAGSSGASEPHHIPSDARLSGFIVIDFGVVYKKYMSDMTRTIYVGKPSKKEREIYAVVLKGQEKGIRTIIPGVKCGMADRVVRDFFGDTWNKYFIHTLGHGVGTRIHEPPKIFWKRMRTSFKENMVVTVEPGLYVPEKWGIRIEDTCLLTAKKCIPLTHSPKNLIIKKRAR